MVAFVPRPPPPTPFPLPLKVGADELKVVVVQAIHELALRLPSKHRSIMAFLSNALRCVDLGRMGRRLFCVALFGLGALRSGSSSAWRVRASADALLVCAAASRGR